MHSQLKRLGFFATGFWLLAHPLTVFAQLQTDGTFTTPDGESVVTFLWFETLFDNVIIATLQLVGLIAFLMIIVGGFRFLFSLGDPKGIETGKKTISLGIGGVALAILAWLIIRFIEDFTGTNLSTFSIIQLVP